MTNDEAQQALELLLNAHEHWSMSAYCCECENFNNAFPGFEEIIDRVYALTYGCGDWRP